MHCGFIYFFVIYLPFIRYLYANEHVLMIILIHVLVFKFFMNKLAEFKAIQITGNYFWNRFKFVNFIDKRRSWNVKFKIFMMETTGTLSFLWFQVQNFLIVESHENFIDKTKQNIVIAASLVRQRKGWEEGHTAALHIYCWIISWSQRVVEQCILCLRFFFLFSSLRISV